MPKRNGWFIKFWRIIPIRTHTLTHIDCSFTWNEMHLASKKRSDCTTCNSKVDTRPRSFILVDFLLLLCVFFLCLHILVSLDGCTASAIDRATCLIAVNSSSIFFMLNNMKNAFSNRWVSSWECSWRDGTSLIYQIETMVKPPFRAFQLIAHSFCAIMVDCHVYLFILPSTTSMKTFR